jgi:hypothetical protein
MAVLLFLLVDNIIAVVQVRTKLSFVPEVSDAEGSFTKTGSG